MSSSTQALISGALSLDSVGYDSHFLLQGVQINQNQGIIATTTISSSVSDAKLLGCSFVANTAEGLSAGIRLQGVALFDSCSFLDHDFTVVFLDSNSSSIFTQCSFERNVVHPNCTATAPITVSPGTPSVRFDSCVFVNNAGSYGSVIYSKNSSLPIEISSSKFINNSASAEGAIYVSGSSSLMVSDSLFELNEGGAIVCYENDACIITSSVFENNRAYFGSAIYFYIVNGTNRGTERDEQSLLPSSMVISECLFNNNTSTGGGTIRITLSTGVFIMNSIFYGNTYNGNPSSTSNHEKGTSYLLEVEYSSKVTVVNSAFGFMSCSCSAVRLTSSEWTTFSNCNFSHIIQSGLIGGAALFLYSDEAWNYNYGNDPMTTFTNCLFRNNWARQGSGGAVYLKSSVARFVDCMFDSNMAGVHTAGGGALFVDFDSTVFCESCSFVNNVADFASPGGGGAVYVDGSATFYNTLFYQNSANYSAGGGGAAYLCVGANVYFHQGCSFISNWANYQSGGAVYQFRTEFVGYYEGTLFSDNFARQGGAIYVGYDRDKSVMKLKGLIFENNSVSISWIRCLLLLLYFIVCSGSLMLTY